MGFFSQIQGPIKSVLRNIMGDEDLRVQITYRKYTGQAFDDSVGHTVDTFSESTLYAVRLSHTVKSALVGSGVGEIQVGDQLYLIQGDDAPDGMSVKDQIKDENGTIQKVKNVQDIFGLAVAVTIEGGD